MKRQLKQGATGNLLAINLTVCDPSIYLDSTWSVYDDICDSDNALLLKGMV